MDYATRLTNFDGGSVDDGVVFLELYRCRDVKISPSVHFLYMKDCADIEVPESVLVVSTDNCRNISLPKSKYDSSCFNPKSDNVHTNVSKKCYEALMSKIDELSLTLNPTEKIDLAEIAADLLSRRVGRHEVRILLLQCLQFLQKHIEVIVAEYRSIIHVIPSAGIIKNPPELLNPYYGSSPFHIIIITYKNTQN